MGVLTQTDGTNQIIFRIKRLAKRKKDLQFFAKCESNFLAKKTFKKMFAKKYNFNVKCLALELLNK